MTAHNVVTTTARRQGRTALAALNSPGMDRAYRARWAFAPFYALISESEKWRADAMIAEAVSFLAGVKLLVLDRFDVLDLKGREDLLYWLEGMAQDGEIDSALIFGTLKALPAQLPEMVAAHWIENGSAGQMKEAA